jgi:ABC-type transport system involved in multi-copper enzyme maturation permease subunit
MLRALASKELRNQLRSVRFWVGAALTVTLAAGSTLIAARDYQLRLRGYQERQARAREQLSAVTVYSFLQPVVLRPPQRLSILDQGLDSRLGTEVTINLFSIPLEAAGQQRGNELLVTFPALDLTVVVSLVLGLLALLLTYDAITAEREAGTLRAILANGVSRRTVLAGKIAGNLLAVALPLAAAMLLSLAVFARAAGGPVSRGEWLRVAGLAGAYAAYLLLMVLLGLWISLEAPGSSRALRGAVLLWFTFTTVIPAAAWAIAGDLPGGAGVERRAEREIAERTGELDRRLAGELQRSRLRSVGRADYAISFQNGYHRAKRFRFGSAAFYDDLAQYYRFETAAGKRYAADVYAIGVRGEERRRFQERLGAALAALSPASLLVRLTAGFANTSAGTYDRFLAACRLYRLQLLAFMEAQGAFRSWRWFTDDPPGDLHPWVGYFGLSPAQVTPELEEKLFNRLAEPAVTARFLADRARFDSDPARRLDLRQLPTFADQAPGLDDSLRAAAPGACLLLLLDALAAAGLWVRFERGGFG